MASKVLVTNPTMTRVTYSTDNPLRSHSFSQFSLPNKNETPPSSSSLHVAFAKETTILTQKPCRSSMTNSSLAGLWREIQGCNNWEDLVEPLHPLLSQEIIRYGEFVIACYKAFDLESTSKHFLTCKYSKRQMLSQVGLENSGYQVTKYIYATPNINIPMQDDTSCSRWIGYVAVSFDDAVRRLGRRDILITFRGTVTQHEWIANFMSLLTEARLDPTNPRSDVKVESGFLNLYTSNESNDKFGPRSCREQLLSEVSRLLDKYKGEEISITLTGHSMGSSIALLLAYDIAELGLNRRNTKCNLPVTVFSFGGPRVGNEGFKKRCEELEVKVLRIVNVNDPITKLPGVFLNENFRVLLGGRYEFPWSYSCYAHVGVELPLSFFNMQNPTSVHDLETYLNLLRFSSRVDIDKKEKVDFLNRARELLSNAHKNLVEYSQTIDNILGWLKFLPLYIFLQVKFNCMKDSNLTY